MLGVILAAAVAAANPSPATQAAPKAADPLVCHMEPIEGSRITHKVCLPASVIAERQAEAKRSLDRMPAPGPSMGMMMGPMH